MDDIHLNHQVFFFNTSVSPFGFQTETIRKITERRLNPHVISFCNRRLPLSSEEYFDSPSLKEPMSLSKILMILSKIDTGKDLARGRVQLDSSREQDRIAEVSGRKSLPKRTQSQIN